MTLPVTRFLRRQRVNAWPLPGLTNWASRHTYGTLSTSILRFLRISCVEPMGSRSLVERGPKPRRRVVARVARPPVGSQLAAVRAAIDPRSAAPRTAPPGLRRPASPAFPPANHGCPLAYPAVIPGADGRVR